MSFQEILTDLANSDHPLRNTSLAELTNLSSPNLSSPKLELFEHVWSTMEPERRRQIVYRLVEMTSDNIEFNFDSIFKNCLKDQDADVRSEAIEGLWENEDSFLIDPLINILKQDSSEKVQAAAATALGKFALLVEYGKLSNDYSSRTSHILLTVVGDENKHIEVRRRALEAIAPLSLPEVKRVIAEAYQSSNDRLRVSSIYAMGKSCDPSWLSILLDELTNTDAEIRYEAVGACGELEEEEAVPHLIGLIDDQDKDVQLATIQTLGKIGGTKAKECLQQCLDDPSVAIHQAAEQALQELERAEELFSF